MSFRDFLENAENGSVIPQIVYHGTDKRPFEQFTYQKGIRRVLFSQFEVESKGFFFSESPMDALEYGNNVAACYINVKNLFVDPRRDKNLAIDRTYEKEPHLLKILGPMIEKNEHGFFFDLGVRRVYIKKNDRYNFQREWIYEAMGPEGLDWDILDNPECVKRMVALGYDGTYVEERESHLGRSIFVPSASQVKIVRWMNQQPHWGAKDDYYTKKQAGLSQAYGPAIADPEGKSYIQPEEDYEHDE